MKVKGEEGKTAVKVKESVNSGTYSEEEGNRMEAAGEGEEGKTEKGTGGRERGREDSEDNGDS